LYFYTIVVAFHDYKAICFVSLSIILSCYCIRLVQLQLLCPDERTKPAV
jgi:hypothetical protein